MRIRTRSIVIMLSQGLTQATAIALNVILVRLISQELFGTYRQVLLVYGFAVALLNLQLDSSLFYFIPKLQIAMRRALVTQTVLLTFLGAALVSVGMVLSAWPVGRAFGNAELPKLLVVYSLVAFSDRLLSLVPAFMISLDRVVRAGVYSLASSIGRAVVVVTTLLMGMDLAGVMWVLVLVGTGIGIVGCVDMFRLSPGAWSWPDRKLLLDQWSYCWPLWATACIAIVNAQFGSMLISAYFTPAVYAVYACGAMELPVVALVTGSVNSAIMPNLVVLAEQGRAAEALSIWQEAARKCSLVVFPCFAIFLFLSGPLMVLLYGPAYAQAAWPFSMYLMMLPLRVAVYASILRAFGKTGCIAISAVLGLVVNVIVSSAAVVGGHGGLLSFVGPAAGTVVATFAMAWYLIWQVKLAASVSWSEVMRWRELGALLGISLVAGLATWLLPLPDMPLALRLPVQGAVFLVLLIAMIMRARILKPDERELLSGFWSRVRGRPTAVHESL